VGRETPFWHTWLEHLNVERMRALMPALGPEMTTARDQRAGANMRT
jgi:hypothetical protein